VVKENEMVHNFTRKLRGKANQYLKITTLKYKKYSILFRPRNIKLGIQQEVDRFKRKGSLPGF